MLIPNQPLKRNRGVILTHSGWERLQAAKHQSEIQDNSGNPFTLEELSHRTYLSPNTLTKIHNRKITVDRQSLESYFKAFNLSLNLNDYSKLKEAENVETRHKRIMLKGQVPLDSPFYVERFPIEPLCYETILQPGALLRIKAPRQMGKTSLMARILHQARTHDFQTVTISFQLANAAIFTDLNRFIQWFCAVVTRNLGLPNKLKEYWDDAFGANYNCTDYFENYLLANTDTPFVLALDEVDVVFHYPEIASDFLGLLRGWYEKAKYGDDSSNIWQKLRLIVVHSTEIYIPLNINQSPFNVGFSVELPEFTREQVQYLILRYKLHWTIIEIDKLMALVGGNPYLLQVALDSIRSEEITLNELLETASAEDGIYTDFLRRQLWNVKQYPELTIALTKVVMSANPVELEPIQAFKLQSMGLVRWQNQGVVPSCDLFRQYFRECLNRLQLNVITESRFATILVTDIVDYQTLLFADAEKTQSQLYQDFQLISQLSGQFEGQILKSIDARLLIYFNSALNAVNCAQEIQLILKQTANLKKEPVLTYRIGIHVGEVIFNYADIIQTGVKIAETLQSEAFAGGICISQTVYEMVKSFIPLQSLNLQELQVEQMSEPILLYKINI